VTRVNDQSVLDAARCIGDLIVAWRRELHQQPEVGMNNPKTSAIILRVLHEIGITEVRTGIGGGTGIAAMIRGSEPGMCLGMRADTDALPIREETGLPFAAQGEAAHACGHDAHVAMLLGAAKILFENRNRLRGSVKLIFQPGEESGVGAKSLVADGVLENPHVDAIVAQHTGGLFEGFSPGQIGFAPERFGFCVTRVEAVFHGVAGHTSMQHKAVDAIVMACNAVSQLQVIMARERHCFKPAVISIGTINGGIKNNVIADRCMLTGTIRSDNEDDQTHYQNRVATIFGSVATSMGGSCDVSFPFRLRSTPIDPEMLEVFKKSAGKVVSPENVRKIEILNTSGEDFSEYCDHIPGLIYFHCSAYGDGRDFPHHHPSFDVNERYLPEGTACLCQFAFDWLNHNSADR
jgi:amidohydrolase